MNERNKINLLTRIKKSLGIDTRSDEINIQLNDLKKEQQRTIDKIDNISGTSAIVNSILNDIDKIYQLAENDVLRGSADNFSIKVISYSLSIERAKKQNFDISRIVDMQQEQIKLQKECVIGYINSIINGSSYLEGNSGQIVHMLKMISNNIARLNIVDCSIFSYEDLLKIKEYLMNLNFKLEEKNRNYHNQNSLLHNEIFVIENSHEKYLADYADELAKQKKKR